MLRQSVSYLSRAVRTPNPSSSSYAAAASSMARRSYARHYSEATASTVTESDGADSASSAMSPQQKEGMPEKGKGPDDIAQKLEAKDKEIAKLKVGLGFLRLDPITKYSMPVRDSSVDAG